MSYKPEYILAKHIAYYLRMQYPKVEFRFDMAGLNLSKAQAGMNKEIQKCRAWPDLFIAEARNGKSGLYIELKADGTRLLKIKSGEFASEHIKEQHDCLIRLQQKNYDAFFGIGFDNCKKIIDSYLKPQQ